MQRPRRKRQTIGHFYAIGKLDRLMEIDPSAAVRSRSALSGISY